MVGWTQWAITAVSMLYAFMAPCVVPVNTVDPSNCLHWSTNSSSAFRESALQGRDPENIIANNNLCQLPLLTFASRLPL